MNKYEVGTLVESLAGHDKNQIFVILDKKDEYLYLVDGKVRTLAKPKRKKIKHVRNFDYVDLNLVHMLKTDKLYDSHIRKAIKKFIDSNKEN